MTSTSTHATTPVYPITSGTKSPGTASETAGRVVDRDPDRKFRVLVNIAVHATLDDLVIDEIADLLGESVLYTRPRASELVNLGVIVKGPRKTASICQRTAHVMKASLDLLAEIARCGPEDEDDLRAMIAAFILDRLESETAR